MDKSRLWNFWEALELQNVQSVNKYQQNQTLLFSAEEAFGKS